MNRNYRCLKILLSAIALAAIVIYWLCVLSLIMVQEFLIIIRTELSETVGLIAHP